MALQQLSLGSSNFSKEKEPAKETKTFKEKREGYTRKIEEYEENKYMLQISKNRKAFKMYALNIEAFLTHFGNSTVYGTYASSSISYYFEISKQDNIPTKYINELVSIYISKSFYESICRTGTPLSYLLDNIDVINQFISLVLKQWGLSKYHGYFYQIPEIKCTSNVLDSCIIYDYYLRSSDVFAIISARTASCNGDPVREPFLRIADDITYCIDYPEELDKSITDFTLRDGMVRAFMWMLLVSKEFIITPDDDIKCNNEELRSHMKIREWNTIANHNYFKSYNNFFVKRRARQYSFIKKAKWNGTKENIATIAKFLEC